MIDDLDDILRELLIRELPIKNSEIDISFDQPNRAWSSRLSRPTLNLYLHDLRENLSLRREQGFAEVERRPDSVVQRRRPFRVDLHYLVTAWATAAEDEHRMLSRTLMALLRNPLVPDDLVPEALEQPAPIPLKVAQRESLEKPSDFWSVIDNQQRPGIAFIATLALNPHAPVVRPLTRTAEVKFGQADHPEDRDGYLSIRGHLRSRKPLRGLRVVLLERALDIEVSPDGEYGIRNIQPGNYTLEITAEGRKPTKHHITVPGPSYDLEV